jgi:hypothetical protein
MRITLISVSIFIGLLAGCVHAPERMNADLKTNDISSRIIGHRIRDFRTLFCSEQQIEHWERKQLCSVEMGADESSMRRIPVGHGLALDEVVQAYREHSYDGQVRVVSQNRIVQTDITNYNPSEQALIEVHPGDLVFLQARD